MEKTIKLNTNDEAIALYGSLDENLRYAEEHYHVRISARNRLLKINGQKGDVEKAYRYFHHRLEEVRHGGSAEGPSGRHPSKAGSLAQGRTAPKPPADDDGVTFYHRGKIIRARSRNQEKYLQTIRTCDIVISVGPAGTGKTYLAMAAAIDALKKKQVARIVLTRPAVEAGESLGFLPGDMQAKVNPYLQPLYDALYDMMDYDEAIRCLERGKIEVAPLAYMRGRTLNDSFVILDEAQNCTHVQMKMFLTRLGEKSKAVVTGDITQIDLPSGKKSGLVEAQMVLANIPDIQFIYLNETDVVRHPLVQKVIKAYEKYERKIPHKNR